MKLTLGSKLRWTLAVLAVLCAAFLVAVASRRTVDEETARDYASHDVAQLGRSEGIDIASFTGPTRLVVGCGDAFCFEWHYSDSLGSVLIEVGVESDGTTSLGFEGDIDRLRRPRQEANR